MTDPAAPVAPEPPSPLFRLAGWLRANRYSLVLVGATLVGAWLRFAGAGSADLWLDECVAWNYAQQPDWWRTLFYKYNHPPLYRLITRAVVDTLGDGRLAMRLVPVLCGVACVPLLAAVVRGLGFSRVTAMVAAVAFAINPIAVYLAQWHRHYSLAMLLGLVLTWFWLRMRGRITCWRVAGYAASLAAGMYTYYLFLVVPLAHGLATWIDRRPDGDTPTRLRLSVAMLIAAVVAFAAFAPWMVAVAQHIDWGAADPLVRPATGRELAEWLIIGHTGKRYHWRGMAGPDGWPATGDWNYYSFAIFLPVAVAATLCLCRRRTLLPIATLGAGAVTLLVLQQVHIVDYYHFSMVHPLLIALHAVGLSALLGGERLIPRAWPQETRQTLRLAVHGSGGAVAAMVLATAVFGLADMHRLDLAPHGMSSDPPFRRGPWEIAVAPIRHDLGDRNRTCAVIAYPGYHDVALRFLLREACPVVPLTGASEADAHAAVDRCLLMQAPKIRPPGQPLPAPWPSLTDQPPQVLYVVAVTWHTADPFCRELMQRLGEDYRATGPPMTAQGVYRTVRAWRLIRNERPGPDQ